MSTPPFDAIKLSLSAERESELSPRDRCLDYSVHARLVVCNVAGIQPSRGEMRDLLQVELLTEVGKMIDVQTLGHNFYQIEFKTELYRIEFKTSDMVARVL